MTAVIVALLSLPLAALRPFQQPAKAKAAIEADGLPTSFKVSFSDGSAHASVAAAPASQAVAPSSTEYTAQSKPRYSCDAYPPGTTLVGTHINAHTSDTEQIVDYLISTPGRCTEAAVVGKAVFSSDETRIAHLAPGGFARFRERTTAYDRAVSVIPAPDGSLNYSATADGRAVPFDAGMVAWLGHLMPEVLREIGINVPERVARLRAQGGVSAVLNEIRQIHSSGAKRAHYEELIQHGPKLSEADAEQIAQQVGTDLASSGDLSAILQMLPIKAVRNPNTRTAIANALSHVASSGDKASTLQVMAPNADPELLLILVQAAETLPSSGDKANYLLATAAEYLSSGREPLRNAYFHATSTLQSSGDMANVLISAVPYSHATQQIASQIVEGSKGLASSGDTENVLISLVSQRALKPGNNAPILAAIQRTMTMASSGDRANVLIAIAEADLLTTRELRDAFTKAAMALPSEGDRENVLTVAAKGR